MPDSWTIWRRSRSFLPAGAWATLALLALLTLAVFAWLPRHDPTGGPLLRDPAFLTLGEAGSPWQAVGRSDLPERVAEGVRFANADPARSVLLEQVVDRPPGIEGLRLTATVALDGVVIGPERWQKARLFVLGVKPDGRSDHGRPHRFLHATGTLAPERRSEVFMPGPALDRARVLLGLPRATGELTVTSLELQGVTFRPVFRLMRGLVLAGWAVVALVIARIAWRRSASKPAAALALGAVATMAALALAPGDVRAPVQEFFASRGGNGEAGLLKLALHLGIFGCVAFAVRLILPALARGRLWCGLAATGLALELGEWLRGTLDRGDAIDLLANLAGASVGLGLACLLRRPHPGGSHRRASDPGVPDEGRHPTAPATARSP